MIKLLMRLTVRLGLLGASFAARADAPLFLPGTQALTLQGDLSAQMVAGIDKFLTRETERSIAERQKLWQRDFSSAKAYGKSVQPNRERLRVIIGAIDARAPMIGPELVGSNAKVAETGLFTIYAVRWPVFEGVFGEGLWLRPKVSPLASVIAIPDADQTPEMLTGLAPGLAPERQFARRLAENGCEVLVPVLIDRQDTWSGNALIKFTNQPHREWIYRQAFEMGRHVIGYEVQKILAAVDWFEQTNTNSSFRTPQSALVAPKLGEGGLRIGLAGYGEGALVGLYAAALDTRINAALISGYFDSRQGVWEEPIYRNVFGLLHEFGDAEIASLIAPRSLVMEHSPVPKIDGPPKPREGRSGAAPGKLKMPDYETVEAEFERARVLVKAAKSPDFDHFTLITGTEGMTTGPGSDRALEALLRALGAKSPEMIQPDKAPTDARPNFDAAERQHRQVKELEDYTQKLLRESENTRADFFWNKIKTHEPEKWAAACAPYKTILWEEVLGRLPPPALPANPRSRKIAETGATNWTGYEIVLEAFPDVFAWGYLLVPANLKPGERRPVVVCQHGLEGVPGDVINKEPNSEAFRFYKAFAARLAERGFIVFAPHNPYRGGDKFRQLQRKANPLKLSIFSFIIAQHDRILDWLSELPFVDSRRIGFYGLSYGGKTAMRVPAVLDRYALSICSGDFNQWTRKNVSVDSPLSYMFHAEYEMPEFGIGKTFDYAELAGLIAPRPFMVERGHKDGVGSDDWVAAEYARVRRLYDELSLGDRSRIEFFDGPHTINGVGTFDFIHKQLNWPQP